jgi:lipid-binding SYLF domain-containing protein
LLLPGAVATLANQEVKMNRRDLLVLAGAVLAAGCASSTSGGGSSADPAAKRREIDASVDNALSELYAKAPGSKELVAKSQGVLVFPKVTSAGFIVGGSYGEGALRKRGATAGYYSVGAGSVGLLAGAQTKAMYMLFMSQEAMQKFEASKGWTAGADASVALVDVGADARVDTKTAQSPVIGYVLANQGFMANLSLDGTKFSKMDL